MVAAIEYKVNLIHLVKTLLKNFTKNQFDANSSIKIKLNNVLCVNFIVAVRVLNFLVSVTYSYLLKIENYCYLYNEYKNVTHHNPKASRVTDIFMGILFLL